jgi:hypothetical protein
VTTPSYPAGDHEGHEAIWDPFLLAIIIGLTVNECCDVSPWAARKLITALGLGSR